MSLTLDQAKGMLLGMAVGDALGTSVEFMARGTFEPVTEIRGGGPFRLEPGQWTDDTSMALCLADSLLHQGGWDAADCARRFVNWREHGYNSVNGVCFDIGNQTSAALDRFLETGDPYAGPRDERQSGNGGIMRLCPAVIAYHRDLASAVKAGIKQSEITHASPTCLRIAGDMARFLLSGDLGLLPRQSDPPERASGYVVHTWQAASWALSETSDFASAVLAAVNLGDDADTTGAVVGQLAGRLYGLAGIPDQMLDALSHRDEIEARAKALWALSPPQLV